MDTKRLEATLTVGMVSIPVGVLPVIRSTEKRVSFTNLHEKCLTPVKQPKHCPVCDVDVEPTEIVSGFKVGKEYVLVTEEEKQSVSAERSHVVEIEKFVSLARADAWHAVRLGAESSHWLVPEPGLPTTHYAVLREGMGEQGVVGLAHSSLWGKEWPVMVAPEADGILLTKLWPSRAVRDFDVELPPAEDKLREMMQFVIDEFTGEIEASDLEAATQDALRELVVAKAAGYEFIAPKQLAAPEPTVDLMEALKASVAAKGKPAPKQKKVKSTA